MTTEYDNTQDADPGHVDLNQVQAPAPRPCTTCPYRQDVPSGIWDVSEYEKLPRYDAETPFQPPGIFQCHLIERKGRLRRMCAGWAGCHDGDELLSLRIAVRTRLISEETHRATVLYETPVPLFASGEEAAAHGMRDILNPSIDAARAIGKILRVRTDIVVPARWTRTGATEEAE